MTIAPLADYPQFIPDLAQAFFQEWNAMDGRSLHDNEKQLRGNLQRDCLPISFVAVEESAWIGTVSMDLSDFPGPAPLSPWLACLYVKEPHRGRGLGRALVLHAVDFARAQKIPKLYLWNHAKESLYHRLGWIHAGTFLNLGHSMTLMELPLA
jgi:predicted N-acetyltransferase YhbS